MLTAQYTADADHTPDLGCELCETIRSLLHWDSVDLPLKVDNHDRLDLGYL